jgi:mono/diheme cytochrome c family protein
MMKLGVLIVLLVFASPSWAAPAGFDLHDYWDQRCSYCHGHSSEFARRFLRVDKGRLLGVHHRDDLGVFLRNHYLTEQLVAPVSAMLMAQLTTKPLFAEKCAACHGIAAAFARKSLGVVNGVLVGTVSARKVADYLAAHGRLELHEVPIMVDTLRRVRDEVTSPGR